MNWSPEIFFHFFGFGDTSTHHYYILYIYLEFFSNFFIFFLKSEALFNSSYSNQWKPLVLILLFLNCPLFSLQNPETIEFILFGHPSEEAINSHTVQTVIRCMYLVGYSYYFLLHYNFMIFIIFYIRLSLKLIIIIIILNDNQKV